MLRFLMKVHYLLSVPTSIVFILSERYWSERFSRTPPGLIGAGCGLPLGEYYIGPWAEKSAHPAQHLTAGAYTRKDLSGHWSLPCRDGA